jgi:hypothetical protein
VTALLGRHTVQARQMLRKILADKIEMQPVGSGRQRGYRFHGALTIERLIEGEAFQTSLAGVAPTGFEPVFESRPRFRQISSVVVDQQHPERPTRLKHAGEKFLETSAT